MKLFGKFQFEACTEASFRRFDLLEKALHIELILTSYLTLPNGIDKLTMQSAIWSNLLLFLAAETISISPSFGAVHTGGFVVISGPPTNLYNQARTAIIMFGDNSQELNCYVRIGAPTAICPVPLFHPESAGMLNVTFTVTHRTGVCTFSGQYRVGK